MYKTIYNGYCYFGNSESLNWDPARQYCRSQQASLVDIQSEKENSIVLNVFPSSTMASWIGLNDIEDEGTYMWVDPPRRVSYFKWSSLRFLEILFGRQRDLNCGFISLVEPNRGMWNMAQCSNFIVASVCKKGKPRFRFIPF